MQWRWLLKTSYSEKVTLLKNYLFVKTCNLFFWKSSSAEEPPTLEESMFWAIATRFFYKQRFFSAQPQCCLTFSWIVLKMLLRCCLTYNHYYIDTHFIFTIFVSMSWLRSIYAVYLWSIFHFQPRFYCH